MELIFGEENVGRVINHSGQRTVRAHTLSWDFTFDSVIPVSFSIEKEIEAADSDKIDEFLS